MTARVHVRWAGEHRFDSGRPDGPTLRVDGSGATGQSPLDALLTSLASCMSADVVDILAKRRTPVTSLTVDVVGNRVESFPKRFESIALHFTIAGEQLEQSHVERAIELSYNKYCSVRGSLREDITIMWTIDIQRN